MGTIHGSQLPPRALQPRHLCCMWLDSWLMSGRFFLALAHPSRSKPGIKQQSYGFNDLTHENKWSININEDLTSESRNYLAGMCMSTAIMSYKNTARIMDTCTPRNRMAWEGITFPPCETVPPNPDLPSSMSSNTQKEDGSANDLLLQLVYSYYVYIYIYNIAIVVPSRPLLSSSMLFLWCKGLPDVLTCEKPHWHVTQSDRRMNIQVDQAQKLNDAFRNW